MKNRLVTRKGFVFGSALAAGSVLLGVNSMSKGYEEEIIADRAAAEVADAFLTDLDEIKSDFVQEIAAQEELISEERRRIIPGCLRVVTETEPISVAEVMEDASCPLEDEQISDLRRILRSEDEKLRQLKARMTKDEESLVPTLDEVAVEARSVIDDAAEESFRSDLVDAETYRPVSVRLENGEIVEEAHTKDPLSGIEIPVTALGMFMGLLIMNASRIEFKEEQKEKKKSASGNILPAEESIPSELAEITDAR